MIGSGAAYDAEFHHGVKGARLPDAAVLLQVRLALLEIKNALREAVIAKQHEENKGLRAGDVVAESLFTVLVDYPVKKERTTAFKEKALFEREYMRKTRLMYETQLTPYKEELGRRLIPRTPEGQEGPRPGVHDTSTAMLPSSMGSTHPPTGTAAQMPALNGYKDSTQPNPSSSSLEARFKEDNPFWGFVHPEKGPGREFGAESRDTEQHQVSADQGKGSREKKKFGLRWRFAQPFKTGKESRPEVEDISGQDFGGAQRQQRLLDYPSQHQEPLQDQIGFQTAQRQMGAPRRSHGSQEGSVGAMPSDDPSIIDSSQAGESKYQSGSAGEALVPSDDDETRRDYFTQTEEVVTVKERTDTFVQHQYFLREYVVQVRLVAEKPLGQNVEIRSRSKYILDSGRWVLSS